MLTSDLTKHVGELNASEAYSDGIFYLLSIHTMGIGFFSFVHKTSYARLVPILDKPRTA